MQMDLKIELECGNHLGFPQNDSLTLTQFTEK